MIILICSIGAACNDGSAEDRMVLKDVPVSACGLAGQMTISAQPGERAKGRVVKIICRGR
ncbi:MAG TPA: hypothetical protein VFG05_06460 [Methylocella sp.]|nr:hypothetical protein [Methylocella sp.]